MNEECLGNATDRSFVQKYLKLIRSLSAEEIVTITGYFNLNEAELTEVLDLEYFEYLVAESLGRLGRILNIAGIKQVDRQRYFVALPVDSLGGFHDPYSLGFQYWFNASFVMTLSYRFERRLRTIELARSYLHDSLHHSTFKSFRRALRIPAKSKAEAKQRIPEIYREQYGFNFRNADGVSYSSAELTSKSPETINLNLLMDGIIVILISDLLRDLVTEPVQGGTLERAIVAEIFRQPFDQQLLPEAQNFYHKVTKPTEMFVDHWGGQVLVELLLRAMVSGDLHEIKSYFDTKMCQERAWEKLFRRDNFVIEGNPSV